MHVHVDEHRDLVTLVSSRVFSPWRAESAVSSAAWLARTGGSVFDVVRADLDGVLPRESPRPAIDAAIGRTMSLTAPTAPTSWTELDAYAAASVTAVRAWAAQGTRWETAYSGSTGLADHLVGAVLLGSNVVPRWTAHLIDLPTHRPDGTAIEDEVADDALLRTCGRLLHRWEAPVPETRLVTDWVLALVAGLSNEIVVGGTDLAAALGRSSTWAHAAAMDSRLRIWERPPRPLPAPGQPGPGGPVRVVAVVDRPRLRALEPALRGYAVLSPNQRATVRLVVETGAVDDVAALSRRLGIEPDVEIRPVTGSPGPSGDYALVVDHPVPTGHAWSPLPLPELDDQLATGVPVVLLTAQDSPLARRPGVRHLPADHPHAAWALFSRLAGPVAAMARE